MSPEKVILFIVKNFSLVILGFLIVLLLKFAIGALIIPLLIATILFTVWGKGAFKEIIAYTLIGSVLVGIGWYSWWSGEETNGYGILPFLDYLNEFFKVNLATAWVVIVAMILGFVATLARNGGASGRAVVWICILLFGSLAAATFIDRGGSLPDINIESGDSSSPEQEQEDAEDDDDGSTYDYYESEEY